MFDSLNVNTYQFVPPVGVYRQFLPSNPRRVLISVGHSGIGFFASAFSLTIPQNPVATATRRAITQFAVQNYVARRAQSFPWNWYGPIVQLPLWLGLGSGTTAIVTEITADNIPKFGGDASPCYRTYYTQSWYVNAASSNPSTLLLDSQPNRVAIMEGYGVGSNGFISLNQSPTLDGSVLEFPLNESGVLITYSDVGELIRQSFYVPNDPGVALASSVTEIIGVR